METFRIFWEASTFKSTTGVTSYNLESAQTSLGTGFNGLTAAVTAAKTNDPLVFFGKLNYTYNQPAHHTVPLSDPTDPSVTSEVAYIRPGDCVRVPAGIGAFDQS